MHSNNNELVKAGHDLAAELNASCGAVNLRDVAKMISILATQLDVTTAAVRAIQAERDQLAVENSYLLPKAASELSNAWVLHKYLIGIQAAIMYLDNGNKKAAQEWLYGTIAGPGFEFPDEVEDIDAWATHQMRGSISHPRALEIIKAETPATDRFIAEQRAQGVEMALTVVSDFSNHICAGGEPEARQYEESIVLPHLDGIHDELTSIAAQLRNEVKV